MLRERWSGTEIDHRGCAAQPQAGACAFRALRETHGGGVGQKRHATHPLAKLTHALLRSEGPAAAARLAKARNAEAAPPCCACLCLSARLLRHMSFASATSAPKTHKAHRRAAS